MTGKSVYAYINNTSQKMYDLNGNITTNISNATKYYQKPVRMKTGQTVVENYTKFTRTNIWIQQQMMEWLRTRLPSS